MKSLDALRVLCIPIEIPVPANSGGRIDVWRRTNLLKQAGAELALLSWFDLPREGRPSKDQTDQLAKVFSTTSLHAIQRSSIELLRRIGHMWRWPSHAASRWVTVDRPAALRWANEFQPDVILLEGLYGAPIAFWLSRQLGVPVVYRSHNIEHVYMKRMLASTSSFKSGLGLRANLLGLERLERGTLERATWTLDISPEDMAYWSGLGHSRISWLPPLIDDAFISDLALEPTPGGPKFDVLYFGNLNTPNNVDGLRWLVHEVLAQVRDPFTRIHVAGSRPTEEVRRICKSDTRITLTENPVEMAKIIRDARVLVNPVRASSGVNLKSVEMLFSRAALVSTSAGVRGLSDQAKACFDIADSASQFATAIESGIAAKDPQPQAQRIAASAGFTSQAVRSTLLQTLRDASRLAD